MKKSSLLLLPAMLLTLAGPLLNTAHADTTNNKPSTHILNKDPKNINTFKVLNRQGFIGFPDGVNDLGYVGIYDSKTHFLSYEDATFNATDSPNINKLSNFHFKALDKETNQWVDLPSDQWLHETVPYTPEGAPVTYTIIGFGTILTPEQAEKYDTFEVGVDWITDLNKNVQASTTFSIN
jgi:hypothetical protein